MSITLQSKVRWSQSLELTHECVKAGMPGVTQTIATKIVGDTGRAGPLNKDIGQHEGVIYGDKVFPPSLTLRAKEKRSGLPDAVADAPEVLAAIKAGSVIVVKEASNSTPVPVKSKDADKSRG
mgnify:FL=1